jgi:hypothetical protein
MSVSFYEALTTLRYFDPDKLRPVLTEFVEFVQARLREDSEHDQDTSRDVRDEAELLLKSRGAPWFALTSFVLPGWRWAGVPIHPTKKSLIHVSWILMRLDDFQREISRYEKLFSDELHVVDPVPSLRRALSEELPKIAESLEESWEIYDSIQALCNLMLEAWRIPSRDEIDQIVKGFIGARKPTPHELETFVRDLSNEVSLVTRTHYGPPPYDANDEQLASLESEVLHAVWLRDWLRNRLDEERYFDSEEAATLEEDLLSTDERLTSLRDQIQRAFHDAVEALDVRLEEAEDEWVSADDRDSIVTGERIDSEISRIREKVKSHYRRWDRLGTPDIHN